jgi:acetolactate synthase-1/2/3 large subunit
MRFVDWLAQRLHASGTRFAFGVPGGGGSLDLLSALRATNVHTVVTAREDAAVIMAGTAGLLAGSPGVAFTTKGPGLASATNGLASAALDRLPVLLVAEAFEPGELSYLSHQVYDQEALVKPILAESHGPSEPLPADSAAIEAWLTDQAIPLGAPGVLLADAAAYRQNVDSPPTEPSPSIQTRAEVGSAREPHPIAEATLAEARSLLAAGRRPIIIAGLEASRGDASVGVQRLAEALGAPVLTTYMAKGVIPDSHRLWAGIFTGGAIEQPCVNEADLIIAVGLDPVELIRKPWPYTADVLEICSVTARRHYYTPRVRLEGNLATMLERIGDARATPWPAAEIAAHRRRFLEGMAMASGIGIDSAMLVGAAVRAFGGREASQRPRLTVDAGAHMFSACAFWPCKEPLDLLISNGLATMGFAVPAAIAAALHDSARGAVAMTGDGGLMMCLAELKTAAETNANVCVIVFNDARLSLIDIKREDRQMGDLGFAWQPPDFAATARGLGLHAWQVRSPDELDSALHAASDMTGPRLVDVTIDSAGYRAQLQRLRG